MRRTPRAIAVPLPSDEPLPPRLVGRYAVYGPLASGGMGTVHLGRVVRSGGFARVVAVKRMHAVLAMDDACVAAFYDEARLAARISHPNVASTLDVLEDKGDLFLVLEYVAGASLSQILKEVRRHDGRVPPRVACGIVAGILHGLHAAHEALDEHGQPLHMVHRDVSPQNVLVGADGTPRLVDFGIAKAIRRTHATLPGFVKGKRAYLAPEQRGGLPVDRRTDVFAAGVVLWEALTGLVLFDVDGGPASVRGERSVPAPSVHAPEISPALDAVIARAVRGCAAERFSTARDFALALEAAVAPAPAWEIAECVQRAARDVLATAAARVAAVERAPLASEPPSGVHEVATRREPRADVRTELAAPRARDADGEADGDGPLEIQGLVPRRQVAARSIALTILLAAFAVGCAALVRAAAPEEETATHAVVKTRG